LQQNTEVRMKGVQFLVDEAGERTAVLIDLKKNPELWEDLFDRVLVRAREKEPRESLAFVKRRFASRKRLAAGG
jgi:hypothetical protein